MSAAASVGAGGAGGARPGLGRNYWKVFTASLCTNLGDGLMSVAVVWLASSLTREATLIALVGVASRLPWLLFSLPAGVITDRYDRRLLVAFMDIARLVVIGALGVGVLLHQSGLPTRRSSRPAPSRRAPPGSCSDCSAWPRCSSVSPRWSATTRRRR